MALHETIARVEASLAERENALRELLAEINGLKAQLASLRAPLDTPDSLSALPRTEAILATLRKSTTALSPREIQQRLHAAGRNDDLPSVTATLHYLCTKERVIHPERGAYLAA